MEQTMESNRKDWVSRAIKQGGVLGMIGVLLTLLIYLVAPDLFASFWIMFSFLVIDIAFGSYATIKFRNETGEYMSFKESFLFGAVLIATGLVINRLFMLLLFNVIDTQLAQNVTDTTIESMAEMMKGWNTPEDKIDEAVDKMRKDMPEGFSPLGLIKSIFWPGLLIIAIIASITGLISKKKQPEAPL